MTEVQGPNLFQEKSTQLYAAGIGLLEGSKYSRSPVLPELAVQKVQYESFAVALPLLNHPKNDPAALVNAAQQIADIEILRGNIDNALIALDLVIPVIPCIPAGRNDYGGESHYFTIAERYAQLGEVTKALEVIDKISHGGQENAQFSVIYVLAHHGYDVEAFSVVDQFNDVDERPSMYGVIAQKQAERGDIVGWRETVDTKIEGDKSGLVRAYTGLSQYHYDHNNLESGQEALKEANKSLITGPLQEVAIFWQLDFIKLALEKNDPEAAFSIAQSMDPDWMVVQQYANIITFLQKSGKDNLVQKVLLKAEDTVEALIDDDDDDKLLAQCIVTDMYLKTGEQVEGKGKLDDLLEQQIPVFETAQKLAKHGIIDAAMYLAQQLQPLERLAIYEQAIAELIEADEKKKAEEILRACSKSSPYDILVGYEKNLPKRYYSLTV